MSKRSGVNFVWLVVLLAIGALVVVVASAGRDGKATSTSTTSGTTPAGSTTEPAFQLDPRGGTVEAHDRIEALATCAELQEAFDRNMANHDRYPAGDSRREAPLSYAKHANERITALGC